MFAYNLMPSNNDNHRHSSDFYENMRSFCMILLFQGLRSDGQSTANGPSVLNN